MRIDIVVVYVPRYEHGHEKDFVPPLTGIHLAALTPAGHRIRVIHQQTQEVPLDSDADLVALSFFSGFAAEAYRLAGLLRARGKTVVAGGPHVTFWTDEAIAHVDAVVIGEAESVWAEVVRDAERGKLQRFYHGRVLPLDGLPTPRYDLLSPSFFVPRVLQATRGCPFTCSFCTVPTINPGFRTRPVAEVIRDIAYDRFDHWWQRKLVWFWDDNLTANRPYVKSLLRAMIPMRRWWLTQASIDITRDEELLDLMERSGCIGIFLGIESFDPGSLRDASKRQNRIDEYRRATDLLHRRGICVMAGFIAGFDHDTPETIEAMADQLLAAGIDVPFLSVLTPFRGTPLHAGMERDGRLLEDRGWEHYNGYNATFRPLRMTPDELLEAHRRLWRRAFSPWHVAKRMGLGLFRLRLGALLMSWCMNAFYGLKAKTRNEPVDMRRKSPAAAAAAGGKEAACGQLPASVAQPMAWAEPRSGRAALRSQKAMSTPAVVRTALSVRPEGASPGASRR